MKKRKKKKPPQPKPASAGTPPRSPKPMAKALGDAHPSDLDAITAEFLEEQLRKIKFK